MMNAAPHPAMMPNNDNNQFLDSNGEADCSDQIQSSLIQEDVDETINLKETKS